MLISAGLLLLALVLVVFLLAVLAPKRDTTRRSGAEALRLVPPADVRAERQCGDTTLVDLMLKVEAEQARRDAPATLAIVQALASDDPRLTLQQIYDSIPEDKGPLTMTAIENLRHSAEQHAPFDHAPTIDYHSTPVAPTTAMDSPSPSYDSAPSVDLGGGGFDGGSSDGGGSSGSFE